MENENIVEISSMCKSFGKKQVFSDFSLSIPAHKITTVFGPSGSGKSTLLNIIGLLENFESGTVRLFGRRIPGTNSSGWPWHASFSSLQDLSWPTSRPGHLIQGTEISS